MASAKRRFTAEDSERACLARVYPVNRSMQVRLIHLIDHAHREEVGLAAELTYTERCAEVTPDAWSAKDTLAHVGEWKMRMVRDLDADQADQPSEQDSIDEVNERIFEQTRGITWSDLLGLLRKGTTDLVEIVRERSRVGLTGEHPSDEAGSKPLWRRIVGIAYIHPLTHISQLRISRGQSHQAVSLVEKMVESLLPLDNSPHWRGELLYDLACTCALAGKGERAVGLLAEALHLQPELIDWSRSDPDFAAMRLEPAYLALYSTEEG